MRAMGYAIAAIMVAAGAVTGITASSLLRGGPSVGTSALPSQVARENEAAPSEAVVTEYGVSGPVFDIAYDESADVLWYAIYDTGGPDYLYRMHGDKGTTDRWELPATDHNGYLGHTKVAVDGGIWITQPYRLVRFDPQTEALQWIDLDQNLESANPEAFSEVSAVPGTWVSAIGFLDDEVLVARHNVPALQRINRLTLTLGGEIPIPDRYAGGLDLTVDASGLIWVTAGYSSAEGIAALTGTGDVVAELPVAATRLTRTETGILAAGLDIALDKVTASLPSDLAIYADSRGDAVGPVVGHYEPATRQIVKLEGGQITGSLDLALPSGNVRTRDGKLVQVKPLTGIGDVAVDLRGNVWFSDTSNNTISSVTWP